MGYFFFFPIILSYWALTKYYSLTNLVLLILISIVFILLIIGTLSRGVWFTLIIISFFVTIINQQWRIIITGLISCLFLFSIAILVLPSQPINKMLLNKFTQINSGKRFEGGTQGSALDLILEQPIKGYGYGNQLYHNVYNERVKDHPNWIFKKSIGPHNVFLAFWFAGGILGLFGILYFCSSIIAQGIQLIRKNQGVIRQASLVLLMSFLGVYVLRGLFENAYINQVGILVGLMLALRHSLLNYQSITSSDKQ